MADPEEQIYLFGDFRLNTSKHLLYNGLGEAVPLSEAFDTLRYLWNRERYRKDKYA